jgi:hypothetical protein
MTELYGYETAAQADYCRTCRGVIDQRGDCDC